MRGADSSLTTGGWRNFASVYSRLRPPLRPCATDVDNFSSSIPAGEERVLLLGVTPELSVLGKRLTAVDNSPRMLANVWPGDREGRRAMLADWTDLPFADGAFDAVIGDGSLNSAPEQTDEVVEEAARVLARGGAAAFRLFCSPEEAETLESIADDVERGWNGNLHALKWRVAMVLAASRPQAIVPVREILDAFNRMFPDRDQLAAHTGWTLDDISTIDAYVDADHSLGFPTLSSFRRLLERHFPEVSILAATGYPLAERCPTVVCRR
jgi:SAM-dependent methyltransferase